jgi:hypothetical protein
MYNYPWFTNAVFKLVGWHFLSLQFLDPWEWTKRLDMFARIKHHQVICFVWCPVFEE